MDSYKTFRFIDILPNLVENYNSKIHKSINKAPKDMNKDDENEEFINNLNKYNNVKNEIKEHFDIGDFVRILKNKKLFQKGSKNYFSKTIYEIIEQDNNKFIIRSENNKVKSVFPYQLKKVEENLIKNPYIKEINLEKDKKALKQNKIILKTEQKLKK